MADTKTATENVIETNPPIPEVKKPSLSDRLKGLKAAPAAKAPAAAKRPEVIPPKEALDALKRFIPADIIRKAAEKRADNANKEVSEIMLGAFADAMWKNKAVPSNPKMIVTDADNIADMSAIFQVQDRFPSNNIAMQSVAPDANDDDVMDALVDTLAEAGLRKTDARNLVDNEVNCSKRHTIRPLNELISGRFGADKQWVDATPQEQAVAEKLLDFLDTLSLEEQSMIRRDDIKVTMKKDFLARVSQYVHHESQVRAVLAVFKPVHFLSHAAVGLNQTETQKVERLKDAAAEIIGSGSSNDK